MRLDIGDVHAVVAVVTGGLCALFSFGCCFNVYQRNEELIIAQMGLIAIATWCGGFAVVLRGTALTRMLALIGLAGALFACCTGMIGIALD